MFRRKFLRSSLAAGVLTGLNPSGAAASTSPNPSLQGGSRKKPRMMFYHDGRHPLIYMYEPPMQKEEYEAAVDELVGTPVEALMLCLGDGRTVLHDTKVGELWGNNVKKWPHLIFRRAHQNAKALIAAGHDPLRILCERAHAKGMLIYATLLVQLGTGERGPDTRGSDFRFNNPQLEIGARGGVDPKFPGFHGLDFKRKEAQEERFALVQETLTRYPIDGFELQLNYMPYYFRPDEVDEGRKIMTAWIARVYRALKQSGSDRELAIRIPASLEGCYSVGLDVKEWIRQGIVDVLIGQTFSGPELVNQFIDFRPLVAAAKGSQCRIHAAIHSHVDSDRLQESNASIIRAAAGNYWAQGVDGLYLAHWFGNWPYQAQFYEKLRELPHPEIMAPKDKFYFVPTVTARYQKPDLEPGTTMQLPKDLKLNQPAKVEFTISDDLPRWNKAGRVHEVLLRFRVVDTTELDELKFSLNGQPLPADRLRKINQMYKMNAPRYRVFGYWFVYSLDAGHWPRQGKNVVEVTITRRDPDVTPQIYLRDVELEIKYLMGKNFHRGQDTDLGPYEISAE
ncbi:MAG: hypothetical protein EXQ58_07095 [Acidobacteria bacterium]|nr:hypothetical protein [Acidobacteriota bacterium]